MKFPVNLFLSLFLLAIVVGGSACNSSSTTPTPTVVKNYLPLSKGNYWIYSRQLVDSVSGLATGAMFTDSAYVMDSISYNGRGAWRVVYVQLDSAKRDTSYFSKNSDGSIYTYVNLNVDQLTSVAPGLAAPKTWVLVKPADGGANTWTSYDTTLTGIKVNLSIGSLTLDLHLTIQGSKGTSKAVSVNGTSYTATEYLQTFTISGGGGSVMFVLNQHFWFIENVGLFQSKTDQAEVDVTGLGAILRTNGTQSTLQRFSAK